MRFENKGGLVEHRPLYLLTSRYKMSRVEGQLLYYFDE